MIGQNPSQDLTLENFPDYLKSYDALGQHFRGQLDNLSSSAKGEKFARFAQRILPHTDAGLDFESDRGGSG